VIDVEQAQNPSVLDVIVYNHTTPPSATPRWMNLLKNVKKRFGGGMNVVQG
jgi:hypothetical protein